MRTATQQMCVAITGACLIAFVMAPRVEGQVQRRGMRMIVVRTEAQAVDLRLRILAGAPFDLLAEQHSVDPSSAAGGYIGLTNEEDLRAEFRAAFTGPGSDQVSSVARVGGEFILLQWMTAEEERWIERRNAGLEALRRQRPGEAAPMLLEAVRLAESLRGGNYALAQSLNLLAQTYQLQQNRKDAVPHFQRSLALLQELLGTDDPRLLDPLNGLAEIYRAEGKTSEAELLLNQSLRITEKVFGPSHENTAVAVKSLAIFYQLQGKYSMALGLAERVVGIVEKLYGPEDTSVAVALNNLATIHLLLGNYREGESLSRRSLPILEKEMGLEAPVVVSALDNLAAAAQGLGKYGEAEQLYWRILGIRWGGSSKSAVVARVLDSLATVLALRRFQDSQFDQALGELRQAVAAAPLGKDLYVVLERWLVAADLATEAEGVMLQAVRWLPDSRHVRHDLADFYIEIQKYGKALEVLEQSLQVKGSPDPAEERLEQSLIHRRIGEMQAALFRFEDAFASYGTALELDPGNVDARLALADLYLRRGPTEMALDEYNRVIATGAPSASAYTGLAEANLRLDRISESIAAAGKALEMNSKHRQTLYVLSMGLIRASRREEAEEMLSEFRQLVASVEADENRVRENNLFLRDVAARWAEGRQDEVLALLQRSVSSDAPTAERYLSLGLAQSKVGLHNAAAETFHTMIGKGFDDFLAHKSLSREYEFLGDSQAGMRHRAIFVQRLEAVLRTMSVVRKSRDFASF